MKNESFFIMIGTLRGERGENRVSIDLNKGL
jgi:hypothetical protein